jgi:serine/threonine-protein phosphatase 4 regulatory subunit 1
MIEGIGPMQDDSVSDFIDNPSRQRSFNEQGYKIVTSTLVTHMNTLVMDSDVDVRRAASEALVGLALQIERNDIAAIILPIPLRLAQSTKSTKKSEGGDGINEELRVTAANLLAELSGSSELGHVAPSLVKKHIKPCILLLCSDSSFRVRRSAAQALPRVLGGTSLEDAKQKILPAFEKLSRDDMYRVRKSTGECLVDMSRSMMILASKMDDKRAEEVKTIRRALLVPIANRLLDDTNKFVRHGMMQFLGPFIASFYPLEEGDRALHAILPGGTGVEVEVPPAIDGISSGIGAQFFPHATSMVSRLNSSMSSAAMAPTPTPASFNIPSPVLTDMELLQLRLPAFMRANRISILSLRTVVAHRQSNPPDVEDIKVVVSRLLKHFVGLAKINTGDENTDAEMKVYCAYSYPAVLLLLGPENWDGMLKDCFLTLINPNYGSDTGAENAAVPPLPVKRCLSSSLHTVAHILGPKLTLEDIMPAFREYFLRDTDDSVRLNVIRNFPWLMSLLPLPVRCEYLSMWYGAVKGEDLLGAHKRSVTNPMLLHWRQRDYVSRSMPDMLSLVDPMEVQQYLWPVLQTLLTDSVSQVREDAEWSIPLLLRVYCAKNMGRTAPSKKDQAKDPPVVSMRWSADVCQEVVVWLKQNILGVSANGSTSSGEGGTGNFSQRQLYCRICAAVGLAIRFSDAMEEAKKEVMTLDRTFEEMLKLHGSAREEMGGKGSYSPYQSLTASERKHLRRFLVYDLLPLALDMKEDRVTNVRLTLMKTLQSLPADIKGLAAVSAVLQDLEDEVETWESVYGSEDTQGAMMASASIGAAASVIPESSSPHRAKQQPSSETLSETTQGDDNRGHDSSGKGKKKRSAGDSSLSHTNNDPEYSSGARIAL